MSVSRCINVMCFSISSCTRVYLNIIYTMVETMRYADPGDCEEMAQAQDAFFTELSKYLSLSRSLSENQEWSKPHKKSKIQFFNYVKTNSTVQKYY